MKQHKIALVLCLLTLGACGKRLDGTLRVSSSFNVNTKRSTVTLTPGLYKTSVNANNNSAQVVMKGPNNQNVSFTLPAIPNLKDKWGSGRTYLRASQIGQSFDVDLNLNVTSQDGANISRSVSCVYDTYTVQEWICRPYNRNVCDSSGNCRVVSDTQCGHESRRVDIPGTQELFGYYTTTRRSGTFKIIRGGRTLAQLVDDSQSRSDWNTTNRGPCVRSYRNY